MPWHDVPITLVKGTLWQRIVHICERLRIPLDIVC